MKNEIIFSLNKELKIVAIKDINHTLLDYLRSPSVGLTGTKYGCGQGGCGACSIIEIKEVNNIMSIKSINSCLTPLARVDGSHIFTIEGLSNIENFEKIKNLVVQDAMKKSNATQCGYCSPGFVINMYSILFNDKNNSLDEIESSFGGNLCRCTGYASILNAMKSLQGENVNIDTKGLPDLKAEKDLIIDTEKIKWIKPISYNKFLEILKTDNFGPWDIKFVNGNTSSGIYNENCDSPKIQIDISKIKELKTIDFTDEVLTLGGGITYSEIIDFIGKQQNDQLNVIANHLKLIAGEQVRNIATIGGAINMVKKYSSNQAQNIYKKEPFPSDFFTIVLAFDSSVEVVFSDGKESSYKIYDLPSLESNDINYLISSVSIPVMKNEFVRTFRISRRIQNAHPIVNTGFNIRYNENEIIKDAKIAIGAISIEPIRIKALEIELIGKHVKEIVIENLASLLFSELEKIDYFEKSTEITKQYKLNCAVMMFKKYLIELHASFDVGNIKLKKEDLYIKRGLSKLKRDTITALYYDPESLEPSSGLELADFSIESLKRGASKLLDRKSMVDIDIPDSIKITLPNKNKISKHELSKIESDIQLNGKAKYVYDLHGPVNTLHGYFIYSSIASGTFEYVNGYQDFVDEIKRHHIGEVHYISYVDVPNKNYEDAKFFTNENDENGFVNGDYDPVFADYNKAKNLGYVSSFGQPIGIVLTNDFNSSKLLASGLLDFIKFKGNNKGVYDFNERTIPHERLTEKGYHIKKIQRITDSEQEEALKKPIDIDKPIKNDEDYITLTGWQNVGAQIHFYMEPNVTLAIPTEDNGLEIYCSSQFLTRIQEMVTDLLNPKGLDFSKRISSNKIVVKAPRLGGGFGAKELRPKLYAGAAAVAAFVLNKPVKLAFDREVDTIMTGTRHPVVGKFRLQGDKNGVINQLKHEYYASIGNSWDCSYPVMELILLSADGAYNIDNFRAEGRMYLTNIQSRTAFRSFGLIQCSLIREEAIEKYAHRINMRPDLVREQNFYKDATVFDYDKTPYGQGLKYCRINQIWQDLKKEADFENRQLEVEEFNAKNKWKKRGISIIPIKYGISYTFRPYNYGNAYVFVYGDDGSVLVHHGGIEMGQGIHTKLVQLAANTLCIPTQYIKIGESGTNKIPNAASTGASTGSDLNGAAVVNACKEIRERILLFLKEDEINKPVPYTVEAIARDKILENNNAKYVIENIDAANFDDPIWIAKWQNAWKDIVEYALVSRINLSAEGFFKSPGFGSIDLNTGELRKDKDLDKIFYYFTYSAAISEVEIDVFTGEFNIIQTDIAYDAGISLNSKIDYGQIEGGFVQGIGYVTTENIHYDEKGRLVTQNTWRYKPPCTKTIPENFNIFLMRYKATSDQSQAPLDKYGIQSSKSTGEPPLVLASTVFFALKHAIMASRKEYGIDEWVHIDAPLTVQKIFLYANCKES